MTNEFIKAEKLYFILLEVVWKVLDETDNLQKPNPPSLGDFQEINYPD